MKRALGDSAPNRTDVSVPCPPSSWPSVTPSFDQDPRKNTFRYQYVLQQSGRGYMVDHSTAAKAAGQPAINGAWAPSVMAGAFCHMPEPSSAAHSAYNSSGCFPRIANRASAETTWFSNSPFSPP